MKDKRVKAIITQWVIPFLILLITMGIFLLNFSIKSREKELDEVRDYLQGTVSDYARDFENTIENLMIAAEPLGKYMENYTFGDVDVAVNVTKALVDKTDAYMAVMCNIVGEGITNRGDMVDLRGMDYFIHASGVRFKYIMCDDDGIEGRRCIVVVCPLSRGLEVKGFLLTYYDVDTFESIFFKNKLDVSAYYSVVDTYGESVCEVGAQPSIVDTDSLWDGILANALNVEDVERAKRRFDDDLSGIVQVETDGNSPDKIVIFAPTDISDWQFVVVANYSYVDTLMMREYENNRNILVRLVLCMIAFAGAAAVGIIVSKVRDNEKRIDLANKADTDMLTSLYNKVATERKISEYISQNPNEQSLLFVLDIDNFKKINDTMGHAFGDEVLRSLGHQIQAYFRVTDVIGRTGGDEFMIFLKGIKDDASILREAHKLEYFFNNFQTGEYVKYSATASIGAAVFPRDASDYESLYKAADKALYTAKQRGKNQLAFYNEEILKNQD